jgi:hypothetical protein
MAIAAIHTQARQMSDCCAGRFTIRKLNRTDENFARCGLAAARIIPLDESTSPQKVSFA